MTKKQIVKLLSIFLSIAMLISCIPLSTFAEGETPETPIFTNGGFETGDFTGYIPQNDYHMNFFSINSDAANVYEGNYSLKIADTEVDGVLEESQHARLMQQVNVEPNTDYTISFFEKSDNHTNALACEIKSWQYASDNILGVTSNSKIALGDWRYSEYTFNSGSCTSVWVHFFHNVTNVTYTYLDNISIIKTSDKKSETGLVSNGDLETGDFTGFFSNDSTMSITTEHARSGYCSLKLQPTASAKTLFKTLTVEKNTDYVVSFYEYNDQNYTYAGILNTSWQSVTISDKTHQIYSLNNTGWRRNRFTFNSGDKTTYYLIFRNTQSADSGKVSYIDDISLNKVGVENANIIDNGGFESGSAKDGWAFGSSYSESFAINEDTNYVKSGDYSLKLAGLDGYVRMRQTMIPIKQNTDYVLSFWAYNGTGNATCEVQNFYDYDNASPKAYGIVTKSGWNKNVIEFNSGTWNLINTNFYNASNTSRTIYIDDIYLAEKVQVGAETSENGTASVDSTAVAYGDTATFTATPNTGYAFDGWYNGEEKVSEATTYETVISEETYLTPQFKAVQAAEINNADFEIAPTTSLKADFGYELGNPINESYDYISITTEEAFTGKQSLKIGNQETPYGDVLYNNFVAIPVSLTGNTEYTLRFWAKGTSQDAAACVRVTSYFWGGTNLTGDFKASADDYWSLNTRTFTPTQAGTYYIMFMVGKDITYIDDVTIATAENITVNTTAGGTVTKTNEFGQTSATADFDYLYGDTVTLTAKPDYCFKFAGWYNGEELKSTDASYTFTVDGTATYEAAFEYDGKGDLNGSGWFDADDLVIMCDIILGKTTEYDHIAADLNGDGAVNLLDFVCLKKRLAADIQGQTF